MPPTSHLRSPRAPGDLLGAHHCPKRTLHRCLAHLKSRRSPFPLLPTCHRLEPSAQSTTRSDCCKLDIDGHDAAFVAPTLALVREDAPQRRHDLRDGLQRRPLDRARRRPLALSCRTTGPPGRRLHADPPLAGRRHLRGARRRPAHAGARGGGAPRPTERGNLRRPARCGRPPRAARGPATTATSGAAARRSTRRSIPSAACWPCSSPRPTRRSAPGSTNWRARSRRSPARRWSGRTSTSGTPASSRRRRRGAR